MPLRSQSMDDAPGCTVKRGESLYGIAASSRQLISLPCDGRRNEPEKQNDQRRCLSIVALSATQSDLPERQSIAGGVRNASGAAYPAIYAYQSVQCRTSPDEHRDLSILRAVALT
jgi:hypothetical protein